MEIVEIEAQHDTFIYDTHVRNSLKIYHLYRSPMLSAINADKNALVLPQADRLATKTGNVAQHQRSKLSAILHLTLAHAILGYDCTYNASSVKSFTEWFDVESSSSWRTMSFSLLRS